MASKAVLEKSIVENYEEWSREVKLLRAALKPFAQIDTRLTFDEYVPGCLIRTADVNRAKSAMDETE